MFKLSAPYLPSGDQPKAIEEIVKKIEQGQKYVVLLGATGTGKTFTIANVIARLNKPTLIISHNKTLAAQLYGELKQLFPENAVEYFISYYDYYIPESYIPETDTYIEKQADINDDIERLRLRTIASLFSRKDVIVVASVSCIYTLGDPSDVREFFILFEKGKEYKRRNTIETLLSMQYKRNDIELQRGYFSVKGEIIDIQPAYEEAIFIRLEFFDTILERITIREKLTKKILQDLNSYALYPASPFITSEEKLKIALKNIEKELEERVKYFESQGRYLEAQRLKQRVKFDLELLRETGTCPGVENYSRHLSLRPPNSRPWTLIDYFPKDFLLIIDESHVTVPQLRAMYNGDKTRKEKLVEFGFRLPSALDNRPLKFEELESLWSQVIFMSATPGPYELKLVNNKVVEQIVRPTGIVDPEIEVRPTINQIDDILNEISKRIEKNERVLITTTTKRTSEELSDFLTNAGIKAKYLHAELDAIERIEILRDLRLGNIDVIVGVNLLREGLDLPEVSLVIITEADKKGFLRSYTSLIQTIGRAARNSAGKVILYADEITEAMKDAIEETERRRKIQIEYNKKHGIIPKTIKKSIDQILKITAVADERIFTKKDIKAIEEEVNKEIVELLKQNNKIELIAELEYRMKKCADEWDFEKAMVYRDAIMKILGRKL
ncbi:MAG: excinuclease ABC subunit UvrB [candidate division WOR-3 bacterium]|nr:excinuclease ABC subunit UvrB [candidate division WOR-3 bacterium]MCX7947127.1 excinuclease ABC subunit UvrB [candidate division WOR-3 bacterium]MDW8149832.1 excinuclease ABC subunit UvrB [candidate division WOR-3 bacterium]